MSRSSPGGLWIRSIEEGKCQLLENFFSFSPETMDKIMLSVDTIQLLNTQMKGHHYVQPPVKSSRKTQEESLSLIERAQLSGGLWHQTCNLESYNIRHNKGEI